MVLKENSVSGNHVSHLKNIAVNQKLVDALIKSMSSPKILKSSHYPRSLMQNNNPNNAGLM